MNKLHLFVRNTSLTRTFLSPSTCVKQSIANKSSDDDKDEKDSNKKGAVHKLNDLLKKIVEDDIPAQSKLKLAKPGNKRQKQAKRKDESVKKEPVEKQVVQAVKDVAQTIGGNAKINETELLSKLLSPVSDKSVTMNLSDIVKDMKIDRETKTETHQSRAEQVKRILQRFKASDSNIPRENKRPPRRPTTKQQPEEYTEKIDLFGSEPLGIFTNKSNFKDGVENKTWNNLYQRELRLAVTHPPANYFQQMILWTEQGKIWKFPIDNQYGMDEEEKVYFAEHVFLEKHLEPWCPRKGPIRHFMELVCVGLSKNPYISVEAKKEHIEWFKNYFEEKKKLLQEVGAIPTTSAPKQKSLE
ncbi:28S ribosomal protein S31, mitochondrial [Aethina tumida]|uniref:28S ribosomal protein S31, mitochondrial n=1 Tax=Aethina tumida TaxID=116153 RepID=UPI00096AEA9A|nr:28S ribosomal protein S31, mitochondrial [Aethina tumida]